jgi:hypothetical protein
MQPGFSQPVHLSPGHGIFQRSISYLRMPVSKFLLCLLGTLNRDDSLEFKLNCFSNGMQFLKYKIVLSDDSFSIFNGIGLSERNSRRGHGIFINVWGVITNLLRTN